MTSRNTLSPASLPHSYPFKFIDRIADLEAGKRIVCVKNVSANEEVFTGHFQDNQVMPAIMIIEAMAQSAGLLIASSADIAVSALLIGIDHAEFMRPVIPGDQLVIEARMIHKFQPFSVFQANARVNGDIVSEAVITLASL